MTKPVSVLASAIVMTAAIACSDSTGPSSVAHHLDSLLRQACARAQASPSFGPGLGNGVNYDTASVYWQRCQLLSVLVAGPASGAEPSPLRVTTGSGPQTWQGIVIGQHDTLSTGAPETVINTLIAYSDPNVTTAVVTFVTNSGYGIYIVANDTIVENGSAQSASDSAVSLGSPCHDTPGLANPLGDTLTGYPPIEYGSSICRLATFNASLRATFGTEAGLDPSLQSVTIDPQPVSGISVIPPGSFYVNRRSGRP